MTASKATRAKVSATSKEQDEQWNRKSVAYYPTPTSQGDDDMADAIPSWTQPVHGEGDWDEACFPETT
jgi:serine/arginine repetitive matrix protein 1